MRRDVRAGGAASATAPLPPGGAATGGARGGRCQGCARSQAAAARSTSVVLEAAADDLQPERQGPSPAAIGTLIAGWPVRLNG